LGLIVIDIVIDIVIVIKSLLLLIFIIKEFYFEHKKNCTKISAVLKVI